jgi:hypothetical protein
MSLTNEDIRSQDIQEFPNSANMRDATLEKHEDAKAPSTRVPVKIPSWAACSLLPWATRCMEDVWPSTKEHMVRETRSSSSLDQHIEQMSSDRIKFSERIRAAHLALQQLQGSHFNTIMMSEARYPHVSQGAAQMLVFFRNPVDSIRTVDH